MARADTSGITRLVQEGCFHDLTAAGGKFLRAARPGRLSIR